MRRLLLAAALVATLVACSDGESSATDETRVPDDAGIVTQVTVERIQLDGDRTYRLAIDVESFRSRTHEVTQLLFWKDKYVHVGLTEDRLVDWIAGLGLVQRGDPPIVQYAGVLERMNGERAFFEDGTVLDLADDVSSPPRGAEVIATLDASTDVVTELRAA